MPNLLKEEVGYKRAAPWAEAMFKMHMANIAVVTNFVSSSFASCMHDRQQISVSARVRGTRHLFSKAHVTKKNGYFQ